MSLNVRFAVSFIDLFITIIYALFRKLLTTFYVSYAFTYTFTYVILSCINVYMFIFIKNEFIVFIVFIINSAMAGPKPG